MRALLLAVLGVACSQESAPYDYAASKGAALYQDMCQVCHGETGEGGLAPKLRDTERSSGELERVISERMPANAPGQCRATARASSPRSSATASTSKALACRVGAAVRAPPAPAHATRIPRDRPRSVRRRRARDGVHARDRLRVPRHLHRGLVSADRLRRADVRLRSARPHARERSRRRRLQQLGADDRRRRARARLRRATHLWTGTFAIGAGHHAYKLVLDQQQWIADPRAPSRPRTTRSAARTRSSSSRARRHVVERRPDVAAFPSRRRRAGFPFDTDADAALVTAAHVDAYLAAAEKLADFAAGRSERARLVRLDHDARRLRPRARHRPRPPAVPPPARRPTSSIATARSSPAAPTRRTGVATALARDARLAGVPVSLRARRARARRPLPAHRLRDRDRALLHVPGHDARRPRCSPPPSRGELDDATGLETWARTLLADPRARDQVGELVAAVDRRAERARPPTSAPICSPTSTTRRAPRSPPRRATSPPTSCSTAAARSTSS